MILFLIYSILNLKSKKDFHIKTATLFITLNNLDLLGDSQVSLSTK